MQLVSETKYQQHGLYVRDRGQGCLRSGCCKQDMKYYA